MKAEKVVTIMHKRGLHLSPASLFAAKANSFTSRISVTTVEAPNETWNGKRVIDLMSIGAVYQATLKITAEGDDAQAAVDTLEALVKADFGLGQR